MTMCYRTEGRIAPVTRGLLHVAISAWLVVAWHGNEGAHRAMRRSLLWLPSSLGSGKGFLGRAVALLSPRRPLCKREGLGWISQSCCGY